MKSGRILELIFTSLEICNGQILLNETMSSNASVLHDEDGDYIDSIELLIVGDQLVNLEGWSLSDDGYLLSKWQFPSLELDPNEFLVDFASDKDIQNPLHTNFKIKSDGETLYLTNSSGTIINSVSVVTLLTEISYVRIPDESNSWGYFYSLTSESPNTTTSYQSIIKEVPTFANKAGYFSVTEIIEFNEADDFRIHYTLDGSKPSLSSPLYTIPFEISESTVIKARFFKDDLPPGLTGRLIMILESAITEKNLPFLPISADPYQLFCEEEGLLLNMPGKLEKPVYIKIFEPDGFLAFGTNAGMKIFGNESGTGYDYQQSLSFFARAKYGDGSFNYRLFKEKSIDSFEAFIVRNNNSVYDLFDGVANGIVQNILDVQAYQPVVIFINGEYWGIENMMEKINEHYVAANFSVDANKVDLLNAIETDAPFYNPDWVMSGDIDHYVSMIDYMREHDLSLDEHYEIVKTMIDVDNFATYQCAEIFLGNQDWPGNNMKWWRPKSENGRWRWIFFDGDASLGAWVGYHDNTLLTAVQPDGPEGGEGTWPNPPWPTLLLRKLLENDQFKNLFIATMCDLLATNFDPSESMKWVNSRENLVVNNIASHLERWDFDLNEEDWLDENNKIRDYLQKRPQAIKGDFKNYFILGLSRELVLEIPAGGGHIQINDEVITEDHWAGEHYEDLSLNLKAIPDVGFEFESWNGLTSDKDETSIFIENDLKITCNFKLIDSLERIVINEIRFSNAPEGDWIELYNPTTRDINLSQWSIVDYESAPFVFPNGTRIQSGQYLVLCQNNQKFSNEYGSVTSLGEIDFGLSKRGDLIVLRNSLNELVDQVEHKVIFPWPEEANAISLIESNSNNALPKNWQRTDSQKTPGSENKLVTGLSETMNGSIKLDDPYPNPFDRKQTLRYRVNKRHRVSIRLLDSSGKLARVLIDQKLAPGEYRTVIDTRDQKNGLYMVMLNTPEITITKTILSYSK